MKKASKITWVIIGGVAIVLLVFQGSSLVSAPLEKVKNIAGDLFTQELEGRVLTPDPLRGPLQPRKSDLTRKGVIHYTNQHRQEAGLSALAENPKLNASAQLKAQDMAEQQYFAHTSPDGSGVGDFVDAVSYGHILVGENLALGNFKDDPALVQAWMDSPGHRENILHTGYSEFGIGLVRAEFEGNEVWFAVQHFAKPTSACPQPDSKLLEQIEANKRQLAAWEQELAQKKQEIDDTPRDDPSYNQKVREYNLLANQYNDLAEQTKGMVAVYNQQVEEFNACAKS